MSSLITNTTTNVAANAQPTSRNSALGKDDFLKMLVMQLRYQDPMNPMKGTEFAAQLAQFSSVEQLHNINSSLMQSLDTNAVIAQSINNALAAAFVGKQVRSSVNEFNFTGSGEVKLGFSLPETAASSTIKIFDEKGNLVRTLSGTFAKGDNQLMWNGKNEQGNDAVSGKYKFEVESKDINGKIINASPYIFGTVSAVRYKAEGTMFLVNGIEVRLSSILEIMQG